jgi:hypothetical protein
MEELDMDTRNVVRLEWLPPPPLERKRKQPRFQPVVYVFDDERAPAPNAGQSTDPLARNWRRGVAISEI